MTKPRYRTGCSAGSQEHGEASSWAGSPASNAWIVNFNNGNSNDNNRNNNARVRACRVASSAGECQGAVNFKSLHGAWRRARRRKVPSKNQLLFEARWSDRLFDIEERIARGTWTPSPSTCFIAPAPKAREIHAPDFGDRVVHHEIVPRLEGPIEPTFIADSYSNRKGKGTHAAVARLGQFVRQVESGEGGGWYLQLDIANFFNSIDRKRLWCILKRKMARAGTPIEVQRVVHALLRHSSAGVGVVHVSTPQQRALVPAHKRLENAAPGCGVPIGNFSSQFLANVYLDPLDQFVKHVLKVRRYLRYVDDFVIVHRSREQLLEWKAAIARFLHRELGLRLKADVKLRRLTDGIDFLGYVVHPRHVRVRRRVVDHARAAVRAWGNAHVRNNTVRATPHELAELRSQWASYEGHFRHANSWRMRQQFHARFPWLETATRRRRFHWRAADRVIALPFSDGNHP